MQHCQNCGQVNNENSNFCRFCGAKFTQPQRLEGGNYEISPPRPYVWKTDEFQISESKARQTEQFNFPKPPAPVQPPGKPFQAPLANRQPQNLAEYHCPRCTSNLFPFYERQVSQAGWIVFTIMFFTPLIFFCWIGLLIKEDVRVCPVCRLKMR